MSKRAASVQLTADNVEEPDDGEEAGKFEVASREALEQRVIKKARRGRCPDQPNLSGTGGIFANLKKTPSSSSGGSSNPGSSLPVMQDPLKLGSSYSAPLPSSTQQAPPTSEYLQQLSSLNNSVCHWIKQHVDKNAYIDLTPIFRDYETHLSSIDAKFNTASGTESENTRDSQEVSTERSSSSNEDESDVRMDNEGLSENSSSRDKSPVSTEPRSEENVPSVNLGGGLHTSSSPSLDLGGDTQPFPPPLDLGGTSKPPDDDSLFAVRTKLFYKKESEFIELGIGTVKVQSASTGSVRLLMRNDTALGTILLNVKVTAGMPISTNKKSVLLVCPVPNPPLNVGEGPVTYLLRVKTAELAEELLTTIKKNISSSGGE